MTNPDPSPIRIVFAIGNLGGLGGTEINALRIAARLDRTRYRVSTVSLQEDGPVREMYRELGLDVVPFPISSLHGSSTLRQGVRLMRWLRREQVDIFHAHDKYANMFGVPWARLAGAGVVASRRWWGGENRRSHRMVNRLSYRFAHAVLANGEGVGRMLHEREGVPLNRVVVVRNLMDEASFIPPDPGTLAEMRRRFGMRPGLTSIGAVANLTPVKDHAMLLRAFARVVRRFPATQLVLVGEGPQREPLQALTRELALEDRVVFAGFQPNQPNPHFLFDISVLSSVSEGLPNSLLEAMAAGRPVVATAVGAVPEAVVHGESGLLSPRADPVRFADSLEQLLASPARARCMGDAGLWRARERFAPEVALAQLDALYQRVVGRHRA